MLLESLPKELSADLVATRQLHPAQVLYRVMLAFQPGGLEEKEDLLKKLQEPEPASTAAEAVVKLRNWERFRARATELKVAVLDASVLLKAVLSMTQAVVTG